MTTVGDDEVPRNRIGSPGDLEVRLTYLPPGESGGLAGLVDGEPRHRPRRVGGVVEEGERPGAGRLRGTRRGGHLLRLDRLDCEHSRRRSGSATDDTAQAQERLDTAEPTARYHAGGGRANDRCRPPRRRGGQGQ